MSTGANMQPGDAKELSARNVTLERGGRTVLSKATLVLEPGCVTAICGPNGAGKSTMLATLAGLIIPPLGGVFVGDELLGFMPANERARLIGFLPQNGEIAWDLSVAMLVALGRLPHGDRGELAIATALEACDLADLAMRPVSTLSGGERARALLARVLAGEPEWILADEPFAALDLGHQIALLGTLRRAAGKGCGVAIVVHDLTLAMNHADHVVVLDNGHVLADGRPDEALAPEVIARVWKVKARWLGEPGQRALVIAQ